MVGHWEEGGTWWAIGQGSEAEISKALMRHLGDIFDNPSRTPNGLRNDACLLGGYLDRDKNSVCSLDDMGNNLCPIHHLVPELWGKEWTQRAVVERVGLAHRLQGTHQFQGCLW